LATYEQGRFEITIQGFFRQDIPIVYYMYTCKRKEGCRITVETQLNILYLHRCTVHFVDSFN